MGAISAGAAGLANASGLYAVDGLGKATSTWGAIGQSALTNTLTQGIAVATGLQRKFSWTGVAAAAVGSATGLAASSALGTLGSEFFGASGGKLIRDTISGVADGAARSVVQGRRPDWTAVTANAFGSALGDAVVGAIADRDQRQTPAPIVDKSERGFLKPDGTFVRGTPDDGPYIDNERALRIQSGATASDIDPYGSGDASADNVRGVRRDGRDARLWAEATGAGDGGRISTRRSGAQLPEVENLYTPLEGFFEGRYRMAANGLTDPNSTLLDKAVYFGLGMAVSPLAMLESPATGLYNSLNNGARMGQNIARANLTSDHDEAVMSVLAAISDGASAFAGLGGPATLLPTRLPAGAPITRGGPIADQMLADNFSPSSLSSSEFNNVRVVNIGEASEPGTLSGRRTVISPNNDAATTRSLLRENESADILVQRGFNVEQNPMVAGKKNPDYRINGEVFDNIAPSTSRVENIWDRARLKVEGGQTRNVVINMADSRATASSLMQRFDSHPIPNLQRVIVIDRAGRVQVVLPRR